MGDEWEWENEHELEMPFTVCRSKGGPYEDEAYACGYEAGVIDAWLRQVSRYPVLASVPSVEMTVHAANVPQIDLIAMRHAYRIEVLSEADGWARIVLKEGRLPDA